MSPSSSAPAPRKPKTPRQDGAPKTPRQDGAPKTLRQDARQVVDTCAGWNSRLAARLISQFLDRELASSGLGVAQLGLMAQIASTADDTLGALARSTGLEQSTLSRNLRTLEAQGLIEIAVVESDLRRRAVWLTETGARRLEAAIPLWRKAQGKLGKHLALELPQRLAAQASKLLEEYPSSEPGRARWRRRSPSTASRIATR